VSSSLTYTEQANIILRHAKALAKTKKHTTINPDDLFRGLYSFLRNTDYFDLTCKLFDIQNQEKLDEYYKTHYNIDFSHQLIKDTTELHLHIILKNTIKTLQNNHNITKYDFVELFYIAYLNLSRQCYLGIITTQKEHENTIKKLQNLIQNPLIHELWLFAFLEILDKIIKKLNLNIKKLKSMDIQNRTHIKNIEQFFNAVESEVQDRETSKDENTSTTKNPQKESKKMTIEYFGTELTKEYKDGFIDPIIGREKEIEQVIYTLLRKTKNNPLLIWEAWVWKTAIVEWLAQKIALDQVPLKLKNKKIFMLDMGTLVAGTKYRWEFESRMKAILEEAMDPHNNIILFIDELHTIIGAWGQENNDAAQMIKPLLARGKIKLIGATTYDEYQKHIEKDAALKRRFQEVHVGEPNTEVTEQILNGLKENYENFHGVTLTTESITTAIKLSQRYILNKHLPDKALDIIDEACARKSTMTEKLENDGEFLQNQKKIEKIEKEIELAIENQDYFKAAELKEKQESFKKSILQLRTNKNIPHHLRPQITPADIWQVLADKIGVPSNLVNESEIQKLKRLNDDLQKKISSTNPKSKNSKDSTTTSKRKFYDKVTQSMLL